jgi:hypothetical protein
MKKPREHDPPGYLRVQPELHKKIKILAVQEGRSLGDLSDELVGKALKERERETARLRQQGRITRIPSPK